MPPVLPTERIARLSYGTRLLRCEIRSDLCRRWVKPGKAQSEYMFSGVPPAADIGERGWHVAVVPTH